MIKSLQRRFTSSELMTNDLNRSSEEEYARNSALYSKKKEAAAVDIAKVFNLPTFDEC